MTPTLGPMPCSACGSHVWYDHGRIIVPVRDSWRRHTCIPAIAGRAAADSRRTRTLADIRAYGREWMRRKRAAA